LAAASAGAGVGRGDGNGAVASDGAGRCADGAAVGSGVMMLTGGVEAAVGKSALVGLPVGIDGGNSAAGPAAAAAGAFHNGA